MVPTISDESASYRWKDIPVLDKRDKRRGWAAKVKRAIALASRKGFDATICVVDEGQRESGRLAEMREGVELGLTLADTSHKVALGVAVRTIEAWTLGAPTALCSVLHIDQERLREVYDERHVEDFHPDSGRPEYRSKEHIDRLAELCGEQDSTAFRVRIAEATSVKELEHRCPKGFKPFADQLRATFSSA